MDIVFKCPHCQTELEVDESASGHTITCPACSKDLVIPAPSAATAKPPSTPPPPPAPSASSPEGGPKSAMETARAMKFVVPVTDGPVQTLIKKSLPPLEAQNREPGKKLMQVKTIRHSDCREIGHDNFDLTVTEFLNRIGEESIVSITPVYYSYIELGTQKLLTDFGVMIIYKG